MAIPILIPVVPGGSSVTQEPEIQLKLNMVDVRSVWRQAQSLQRWILAKMCYKEQPFPFLLPLTNIFFKLYFKNRAPLVAYGDASLNPWLAKGSVQHPFVRTFPQNFQTLRRVFLSHLFFPTFLPSSTTFLVVSPETADQLLPEKLRFLPTSSLQLRQMKTSCQPLKLEQMKASSHTALNTNPFLYSSQASQPTS